MEPATWSQVWALASAVFWAFAVVLFKRCGEQVPPLTLNLFKNSAALLVFVPLVVLVEGSLLPRRPSREWLWLGVSGVLGITIADTFFFMALNRLGAGLNAIVDCLYAPFLIAQAALFLAESLPLLAFAGAALIAGGILLGSLSRSAAGRPRREVVTGVVLAALGMVAITSSVVIIKPFLSEERIFWTSTWRLVCGSLPLLPLSLLLDGRRPVGRVFRPARLWRLLIPASLLGAVLAMAAWIAGFALGQVSGAAILNQLSTILVFLLAAVFLGERLTPRRIAAVGLAFAGAILAWTA